MSSNPNLNFTHSKCRLRRIKKVQFGVFAPDVIVSSCKNYLVVCCVNFATCFESNYLIHTNKYYDRKKAR
jgi:hypothetical protein